MSNTASVLWLMILLVFVPIAGAHAVARYLETPAPVAGQVASPQVSAPSPEKGDGVRGG